MLSATDNYCRKGKKMERKLAAILSADVQGYSRLMGDDEEATIRTLTAYREAMTSLIQQHRGRVVDSPGDNLLAEFASAVDAVQSAVEIQRTLKTHNTDLPTHRQMHYRLGINVGDVVVEGERIYGDGVNIAARLESLAEGGGIVLSGTVYDQVKNKLPLTYTYQGEQSVKNIADPVRMYRVELNTESDASVPEAQPSTPASVLNKLDKLDIPSLAVLPFTNMSTDPEQEYFSDGMTEDLITRLVQNFWSVCYRVEFGFCL
jgi:adenylate cyclase